MKFNHSGLKLGLLTSALLVSTVHAVDISQLGNDITFGALEHQKYQLKVKTPNGEVQTFNVLNGKFTLTPNMLGLKSLNNGQYKYELVPVFTVDKLASDVRALNDESVSAEYTKAFKASAETFSGVFTLSQDALVAPNLIKETAHIKNNNLNDTDNPEETRDQVVLDDQIVVGSICAGMDCVNGESFGFDTIRLKENNLRIKFQDTSSSASFPNNDWQITANDSANGGANKFSIDDISGGRTPFTIEASAPSHSLYVDDGGRLGFGTATPVVELHLVDGDSPTLRLEQNGSSGFTPQTWDIAGNETNFFIRDATNGSRLPFKIRPSAPTNSLFVDTDGDIGFSTASPSSALHIVRNTGAGADMLKLQNNGGSFITMMKNTKSWFLTYENAAENFGMSHTDTGGGQAMQLTPGGNLTLKGTLTTAGTTCSAVATSNAGCDLVFSDDYKLASIEEHSAEMFKNSYLPNVGPTVENAPFNITEKTGGILNELEKAHIYIAQLNSRLNEKTSEFDLIKQRLAKLEEKIN